MKNIASDVKREKIALVIKKWRVEVRDLIEIFEKRFWFRGANFKHR
jgi:hypothetical protein